MLQGRGGRGGGGPGRRRQRAARGRAGRRRRAAHARPSMVNLRAQPTTARQWASCSGAQCLSGTCGADLWDGHVDGLAGGRAQVLRRQRELGLAHGGRGGACVRRSSRTLQLRPSERQQSGSTSELRRKWSAPRQRGTVRLVVTLHGAVIPLKQSRCAGEKPKKRLREKHFCTRNHPQA